MLRERPILLRGTLGGRFAATAAFLVLAVVAGGSSRYGSGDLLLQLCGIVLIVYLAIEAARPHAAAIPRSARVMLGLLAAAAVLPLLYAIPIPPAFFAALPGRALAVRTFATAGVSLGTQTLGLKSGQGSTVALAVLPPAAAFAATVMLSAAARRWLVAVLLCAGVASLLLGIAQIVGGSGTPLRFHDQNSLGGAQGFFANRNHLATMLLAALPLAAALASHIGWQPDPRRRMGYALALAAILLFLIGLGLTRSRAGVILGVFSLAGSLLLLVVERGRSADAGNGAGAANGRWPALSLGLVGILLCVAAGGALTVGLSGSVVSRRFDDALTSDSRADFARHTITAARLFSPVGAGPDTFTTIYPMVEPASELRSAYVNHAHDEYLEVWLEYGAAGLALVALLLAWWVVLSWRAWFRRWDDPSDRLLARAASIATAMFWMHSFVDYPIRTAAGAVIGATLLALLVPAVTSSPVAVRRRLTGPSRT